jgi:hypothetical protein
MNPNLKNHTIWNTFDTILSQIDVKSLVTEHLKCCDYKLNGYWHEDEFYEEVTFVVPLRPELTRSALGKTHVAHQNHRWIQLQFILTLDISTSEDEIEAVGELTLILDSDQRIIDENWWIDVGSPYVIAKKT